MPFIWFYIYYYTINWQSLCLLLMSVKICKTLFMFMFMIILYRLVWSSECEQEKYWIWVNLIGEIFWIHYM